MEPIKSNGVGSRSRIRQDSVGITGSVVVVLTTIIVISALLGVTASYPTSTSGSTTSGILFFSQVGDGVKSVSYNFDAKNHSFALGTPVVVIRSLPGGADGMVFDPSNGYLLVGSNGGGPPDIHVVNASAGSVVESFPTARLTPSHVMIDPTGKIIWTSSDPGTPVSFPADLAENGTAHPLHGNDTGVSTIAWKDQDHAFYTSSGPGGYGHFGTLDLTTFTTRCVATSNGACRVFPSAHGMAFDPFTNTVIIFGSSLITQFDPSTLTTISNKSVPGAVFDQGTVDGYGHLFVASNSGTLFFEDYSANGRIGDPNAFSSTKFLVGGLDDVAPLVGPGSQTKSGVMLGPALTTVLVVALILPASLVLARTVWKGRKQKETTTP